MGEVRPRAMFPLQTVLFPGAPLPLRVFEPRYREMIMATMTEDRSFGVVLIRRGSEVGGGDERHEVATLADIEGLSQLESGQFAVLVRGTQRLKIHRWLPDDPYPLAETEVLGEDLSGVDSSLLSTTLVALRHARGLLSELRDTPPLPGDLALALDSPGGLIDAHWTLCDLAPFDVFDRQRLLSEPTVHARLILLQRLCNELSNDVAELLAQGDGDLDIDEP